MRIGIVGTGYVGLVTGTCFAEMGNDVLCLDRHPEKIAQLTRGEVPFYEPGLPELVQRNLEGERLRFTMDLSQTVAHAEILFIAVGTPPCADGQPDLQQVEAIVAQLPQQAAADLLLVIKSTVPVGTTQRIQRELTTRLAQGGKAIEILVASNPEFLREGTAVEDFMRPDRVVIGVAAERARALLERLYQPFVRNGHPICCMDPASAELTKYAANALLSTKISFMNELAGLCEATGADIEAVRRGIGSDPRIGLPFLYAGVGFGGSCFPKDLQALQAMGRSHGVPMNLIDAVDEINRHQRQRFIEKITHHFGNDLHGRRFALWGLAFKPGTDDLREAPAWTIVNALLQAGAGIDAYDPVAMPAAQRQWPAHERLRYVAQPYAALEGADALCLVTEWRQFREPDFARMRTAMRTPVIFDGRNQYDPAAVRAAGFTYYAVGRGTMPAGGAGAA